MTDPPARYPSFGPGISGPVSEEVPEGRHVRRGDQPILSEVLRAPVVFGSTRHPHLARSLGSAHGEFERGLREGTVGGDRADDKEAV